MRKIAIRYLVMLAFVCAIPAIGQAQTTDVVSATVTDPNGTPCSGGIVKVAISPTNISPTVGGVTFALPGPALLDINGHFSMTLFKNSSIDQAGTRWVFTVNCNSNLPPPVGSGGQVAAPAPQNITVDPTDLSATISAALPLLTNINAIIGSVPFSGISNGTAVGETFIMGAGSTLSFTGGGIINASECNGAACGTIVGSIGATEVGFGSAPNTLTSSANFTFTDATGAIITASADAVTPLTLNAHSDTQALPVLQINSTGGLEGGIKIFGRHGGGNDVSGIFVDVADLGTSLSGNDSVVSGTFIAQVVGGGAGSGNSSGLSGINVIAIAGQSLGSIQGAATGGRFSSVNDNATHVDGNVSLAALQAAIISNASMVNSYGLQVASPIYGASNKVTGENVGIKVEALAGANQGSVPSSIWAIRTIDSQVEFGGGTIQLDGTTGHASIGVAAAAGTPNPINLPTSTGTSGQILSTDGANPQQLSWITTTGSTTVNGKACALGGSCTLGLGDISNPTATTSFSYATNQGASIAMLGTATNLWSTDNARVQFLAAKNTTAAIVGTSQGSPGFSLCGRAFHSSADVEDCMTLGELPGNGNDAAITFNYGHTGTSTGAVTHSFAGLVTATTIDATKLTGNLPAISGASLTNIPACATCVVASSPGAGLAHFAGSTQTVTSSAVIGSDMTNNTVTATQLAAQYSKWAGCGSRGIGDGLNAIPAGTYLQFACVNDSG